MNGETKKVLIDVDQLKIVDVEKLSKDAVIVYSVDIGNMPLDKAKDYMNVIRASLCRVFGEDRKIMIDHVKNNLRIVEPEE